MIVWLHMILSFNNNNNNIFPLYDMLTWHDWLIDTMHLRIENNDHINQWWSKSTRNTPRLSIKNLVWLWLTDQDCLLPPTPNLCDVIFNGTRRGREVRRKETAEQEKTLTQQRVQPSTEFGCQVNPWWSSLLLLNFHVDVAATVWCFQLLTPYIAQTLLWFNDEMLCSQNGKEKFQPKLNIIIFKCLTKKRSKTYDN